jgi:hypothetical protein
MERNKLILFIVSKIAELEQYPCLLSDLEIKKLKIRLQDVMNSKCPLIKESL